MAVFLIDNPPAIRQFRSPRRAKPSGVCVVHTAESFPDETGPDTGAENVANFIGDRSSHGSYHDLVDSDSIIQLVRYSDEAFHDATGSNPHSYGVSAATQAHRWPSLNDRWVDATVRNMARAAARYARWIEQHHGVTIPARRITRSQSERRDPGFISHAERDPARRTDPGASFPWRQFLDDYAAIMAGEEDDMTPEESRQLAEIRSILRWRLEGDALQVQLAQFFASADLTYGDESVTRDAALENAVRFAGYATNDVKWRVLPQMEAVRAAVNGDPVDTAALAAELATLLLPEVGDVVRSELADVDGVDENAVVEHLVAKLGAKLSAPDA